ncbi:unnamed protein product [Prunus armeniaca]
MSEIISNSGEILVGEVRETEHILEELVESVLAKMLRRTGVNGEIGGSNFGTQCAFWKRLWHLEVPNKVKISLNFLPTALNLVQRKVLVSAYCSGCGTTTEDVVHAFWGCKRSRRFWALTSFNIDLAVRQGSFAGFLERVWKLRNEVLFGKIPDGLSEIVEWIMEFLEQFKIRNVHTKPARVPRFIRWIKPLCSALLLNLTERLDKLGFADHGPVGLDVLATECAAIHMRLLKAAELGIFDFLVASDSKEVVALLKGDGELWSNLVNIVDDIRRLLVQLCVSDVLFQPHLGNRVAHSLAQFGL